MGHKTRFDVSPRMQVYVGEGDLPADAVGTDDLQVCFALAGTGHATVTIGAEADATASDLVFVVDREGCRAILGQVPDREGCWFLDSAQREIAVTIATCALPEPAGQTLRIIKSVELLCAVTTALHDGSLTPADTQGELSERDVRRILSARRIVDERWQEKLTLDGIARDCGLNRAKLTRGFRTLFACTVADAIAANRLDRARRMLLATDLPVSAIGFRCGYLNNASFARAFGRRFGQAPSLLRAGILAA